MNCPSCGVSGAYVGMTSVECANVNCVHHVVKEGNKVLFLTRNVYYYISCSSDWTIDGAHSSFWWPGGPDSSPWTLYVAGNTTEEVLLWTLRPEKDATFLVGTVEDDCGSADLIDCAYGYYLELKVK